MPRPACAAVSVRRRRALRILVLLFFSGLALLLTPRVLYAGTVTIVDGPNVPIDTNTFNDAYIQAQLAAADFTINTAAAVGGGPNDLRIEPGVLITWTSGFSLTLVAQEQIVVSGTIQHDGLGDGSGGVALLADGDVLLGLGTQLARIAVGSRHGLTRVDGVNVRLQGGDGSGEDRSVQVGFHAVNQGAAYAVTGPISVTASGSVMALAGSDELNFVQVGHGGAGAVTDSVPDGLFSGDIAIVAGANIAFIGGGLDSAYAQAGNGGFGAIGDMTGSHTLSATQTISFTAGGGDSAYAQAGNGGGMFAVPNSNSHGGNHRLFAGIDIVFTSGGLRAYAQAGNGGASVLGSLTGDHTLRAQSGDIVFTGGGDDFAYAQAGNGGHDADSAHNGDHHLTAGGDIAFTGGGEQSYAQAGNGGYQAYGNNSGDHTLTAGNGIAFTAGIGNQAYAQAGNGGGRADGNKTGSHTLSAAQTISFTAGGGVNAYAQAGNGGGMDEVANTNSHGGNHTLSAGDSIDFAGGSGQGAYAQAGNGGSSSNGVQSGSHTLTAGGDIAFTGGGDLAYAQAGNGGFGATGSHSGDHTLVAGSDVSFTAGIGSRPYAQAGNGGFGATGDHSGDHRLTAGGDIAFTGGGIAAYAQAGNGGFQATGDHSGDHSLTAGGDIAFTGGDDFASAQAGNGGYLATGDHSGDHSLTATMNISFTAGSGNSAYAQAGNGGIYAFGDHSGSHTLTAAGDIAFTGGVGVFAAYAQAGNGGYQATGDHSGDHTLRAQTGDIAFTGGGYAAYAQAGNGGDVATGNMTGSHTLSAGGDITFTGGSGDSAYAQAGNGGIYAFGDHSGSHTLTAAGDIAFTGGVGVFAAYAQAGNGGYQATGDLSGDHRLTAQTGDISFTGGGYVAYAQAGNGGFIAEGNHSGDHTFTAGGDIAFTTGGEFAYAQAGNGGYSAIGNMTGSHTLSATQTISFTAGSSNDAYAQAGNGGSSAKGSHSGDHRLTAQSGDIVFSGGGGYAQAGNGGGRADGSHSGNHRLTAQTGDIVFAAGSNELAYAQAGNGGGRADGSHSGSHTLQAGGDITFTGGSGEFAYAQAGNGGLESDGDHGGDHTLSAGVDIAFTSGAGGVAYAQTGNGGHLANGNHSGSHALTAGGDIRYIGGAGPGSSAQAGNGTANRSGAGTLSGDLTLLAGQDLVVSGARIGHVTTSGALSITSGNTYIGVSQNNPYATGSGQLIANVTNFFPGFNSAPAANGGELRFYVPDADNVTIAANTAMNAEFFPGSVPAERTVGFFLFADGPYIVDYSFYFGLPPDVGLAKQVQPAGVLLPGQPLTYTLTFANSGLVSATNVILTDTLPALLTSVNIVETLDPGVTITQTGSAPNLAWAISDLAPGQGGEITLFATVSPLLNGDAMLTNTTAITATGDITLPNNSASVSAPVVVPRVQFAPAAYTVLETVGTALVTVALDRSTPYAAVTVDYTTLDGSALAPEDYAAVNATLTITPGFPSAQIAIPIVDDAVLEADELFTVALSNPSGAALGADTTAQVTIRDDDSEVFIAALDADKPEGDSGSTPFTFAVTRTGYLTGSVSVSYTVSGGVDGADFAGGVLPNGSLTFSAGEASQTLTLDVQGDSILELDEPFTVTLNNPSPNATIVTAAADGVIRNDDSASLAIDDVSALEGNSGAVTLFTFTVTLSGAVDSGLSVDYATADGSATAGADYTAAGGTLTFGGSDGETEHIVVQVTGDAELEPDETFNVLLDNVQAAGRTVSLSDDSGLATIGNDDSDLFIAALAADKLEGNSGTTPFTFAVTRTGYLTAPVSVDYVVSGSVDGADFAGGVLPNGSLTFNAGEASQTLTLDVGGDLLVEPDEPFTVTLNNPSPNATVATAAAGGVIRNDDEAAALTVSKQANVSLARVGETITYTVRITNSGPLSFTQVTTVDDALGVVPLDQSSLEPGESASAELVYTVQLSDLPGPLENTVTVTGTPVAGASVVVSAQASVELVHAAFSFSKTVGIEGSDPECSDVSSIVVPMSTTIVYCFTIINTGNVTLTTHTLTDSHLGLILDNAAVSVAPGAAYSTTVTRTITASETNTAVWTAGYAGSDEVAAAALPAQNTTQATVTIQPTGLDPDEQPGAPTRLFLPAIGQGSGAGAAVTPPDRLFLPAIPQE